MDPNTAKALLSNEMLFRAGALIGIFGLFLSTISKQWITFLEGRNKVNAATDKAKLIECESTRISQQEMIESFRSTIVDFARVSEALNRSIENITNDNDHIREDLDKSKREFENAKAELVVVKTLQLETLKALQGETQKQLDMLVSIVTKFVDIGAPQNVAGTVKTTIEVQRTVDQPAEAHA